ncbi:MAG: TnsA endonuclease N-terminal domain-containing protein [Propionivibrio sp.]
MRTTKRFTPTVLARFAREGRGNGLYETYVPWHRVSRGDPSSRGRSHLQMWNGRQRELLSDGEWVGTFFAAMLPGLKDIREQFPLSVDSGRHELADYVIDAPAGLFPGTKAIAEQLNISHPAISSNGKSVDWTPTTDLLLLLQSSGGALELLAIAVKPTAELTKGMRKSLALENAYWDARGVPWLLITPEQFDNRVALTLRCTMPWALGEKTNEDDRKIAASLASKCNGRSLTHVLEATSRALDGDFDRAQRAFWQAVWCGDIPLDLRRGWRPHTPISLLPASAFWEQNPVASRRSAWN